MKQFESRDTATTEALAGEIIGSLTLPVTVGLVGVLGAGKTVFVRGAIKALGGDPRDVRSPTFTLLNVYDASVQVNHFDLYRLESFDDLESIGFFEFTRGDGLSLVEWADKIPDLAPEIDVWIRFDFMDGDSRLITVETVGRPK